jgi:hypothetical protein
MQKEAVMAYFKVRFLDLSGESKGNHKILYHDSWPPDWDSKSEPPEYEAEFITTQLQHSTNICPVPFLVSGLSACSIYIISHTGADDDYDFLIDLSTLAAAIPR